MSAPERGSGPHFGLPVGLAQYGRSLLVVDELRRAVLEVDQVTGNRRVVANDQRGEGPTFDTPQSTALSADGSRAFVFDGEARSLVRVDVSSGNRTIVANSLPVDGMAGVAIGSHDRAYLNSGGLVSAVDLSTGEVVESYLLRLCTDGSGHGHRIKLVSGYPTPGSRATKGPSNSISRMVSVAGSRSSLGASAA